MYLSKYNSILFVLLIILCTNVGISNSLMKNKVKKNVTEELIEFLNDVLSVVIKNVSKYLFFICF